MDSLYILVEQGKVLYLGVCDTPGVACTEGSWSAMHCDFERNILPVARAYGLALCPWDVLGSGKFQTEKAVEERARAGQGLRSFSGAGELTELEGSRSSGSWAIESVAAVAHAYVRSKAPDVIPIVGGRKVEHLRDDIDALGIKFTEEQIAFLEGVQVFDVGFPTNFLGPDPNITGHSARLSRGSRMSFPNARRQTSV
ncbi:putative aryl-alcohol dehydrogenase AAD10 [Colletotrichum spinosum]|uniref:Putative aryl-alcohol dehydrogenase AAD10 n=1 Tax=Colletotrichum spinosum TaxID=1347390 RepID=A0A4R8PX09_9PEZI|nr:putative aryl-alcohol dehydrogenase AAD10 [Colletotrichum spinosum]